MIKNIRQFEYYIKFDDGKRSENFEWDEELSSDELAAYNEFITFSQSLDEAPLIQKVIERVESEILSGNLDDFIEDDCGYDLCIIPPGLQDCKI